MRQRTNQRPVKIQFWGTESIFSATVFQLLVGKFAWDAVIIPGRGDQPQPIEEQRPAAIHRQDDELMLLTPYIAPTPVQLAWQHQIPVYALRSLRDRAHIAFCEELAPDIVCVACFPWRIPESLLRIPTYGFVNLHPSKLPAYRGPAPLFWQLRDGVSESAVTLHRMAPTFDSGDIIRQQTVHLTEGAHSTTLDQNYAAIGATMLGDLLTTLHAGGAMTSTPQPAGGSSHPWPRRTDFELDPTWSARRAFNFVRGTTEWQQPSMIRLAGKEYLIREVIDYQTTGQIPQPVIRNGAQLTIQFNPGVLNAITAPDQR